MSQGHTQRNEAVTDLEGACRRMAQAWMCDCEAGYCRSCQDAKAVIAAARATHGDINALAIAQAQIIVDNQLAAERQAREQAEARAACEAEGRFQAEAKAERLEAALRKYGEHYEGCHGGHRCHCGLSAALGEKP